MPNIIRRAEVQKRTGYPTSTLYDLMAKGRFPKPVKLSSRAVGWLETEVNDHIATLIAARDRSK